MRPPQPNRLVPAPPPCCHRPRRAKLLDRMSLRRPRLLPTSRRPSRPPPARLAQHSHRHRRGRRRRLRPARSRRIPRHRTVPRWFRHLLRRPRRRPRAGKPWRSTARSHRPQPRRSRHANPANQPVPARPPRCRERPPRETSLHHLRQSRRSPKSRRPSRPRPSLSRLPRPTHRHHRRQSRRRRRRFSALWRSCRHSRPRPRPGKPLRTPARGEPIPPSRKPTVPRPTQRTGRPARRRRRPRGWRARPACGGPCCSAICGTTGRRPSAHRNAKPNRLRRVPAASRGAWTRRPRPNRSTSRRRSDMSASMSRSPTAAACSSPTRTSGPGEPRAGRVRVDDA